MIKLSTILYSIYNILRKHDITKVPDFLHITYNFVKKRIYQVYMAYKCFKV